MQFKTEIALSVIKRITEILFVIKKFFHKEKIEKAAKRSRTKIFIKAGINSGLISLCSVKTKSAEILP